MNEFSFSMPEFLQQYYAPPKRQMGNWLEGAGMALPDAQQGGLRDLTGQMQGMFRNVNQFGGAKPWQVPAEDFIGGPSPDSGEVVNLPERVGGDFAAMNPMGPGTSVGATDHLGNPWGNPLSQRELDEKGRGRFSDMMHRPWQVEPEGSPPNRDSDNAFPVLTKPGIQSERADIGPYPWKPRLPAEGNSNRLPGWNAAKPTGTPIGDPTMNSMGPVTSMGPRMGGAPMRPRIPPKPGALPRFADGGRIDMPDYLSGFSAGKGGPAGNSAAPAGASFSAPPSKMAPVSAVAPGGGELNIQSQAPVTLAPPAPTVPGEPVEQAPEQIILPNLGRSRRSLSPTTRGYTPGGSTYGVAKLRTTRNIMPRFADGGRVPSLSSPAQMIAGGIMDEPMFNMFTGEDPVTEMSDMDADGYECGGRVKGYASGGRVPAAKGKTLRQIAAENGWQVDWDRLNQSGNDDNVQYRKQFFDQFAQAFDPYGSMGATAFDPMGRAGEVDVSVIPDNLKGTPWEAVAKRLGVEDAPTLRGLIARGRGAELYRGDRGMYNEYLADLGNAVYDEELGLLPGDGGFQEGSRVGRSFDNMKTWGPGVVLAGGMLSNIMQTGSMFGGGTGAGAGGGAGGGAGSAAGISPPPLEGAGALTSGSGTSAASAAAAEALPGMAQAGVVAPGGGALVPGMSYVPGSAGLLGGGAGDAAGTFDATGWDGTGINGATGTTDPSLLSRIGTAITNNPLQAARIAATIAGGLASGGGGGDDVPDYEPVTGGPVAGGPAAPAPTKPWEEPNFGGGGGLAMSGGGNFSVSVPENGYYAQAYRPLEDEVLRSARERMDPSFRESKALEAVADVANAFQAQRGALARDASRRGLRAPTSRDMIGMAASEGAARALAANKARRDMEESAIAQGAGLVNQGQRYIDRDTQLAAAATNAGGSMAAAQANAQFNRENAAANRAFQASQQERADANRRYEFDTNAGLEREKINRGIYTSDRDYQQRQQDSSDARRQRNLQGIGTIISGIGSMFGKGFESGGRVIDGHAEVVPDAEDGGRVDGPGHETSDSIPARLSKGEMVLNTDAVALVDKKAPGLVDRINQLGLVQRALKSGVVSGRYIPQNLPPMRKPMQTIGVRG